MKIIKVILMGIGGLVVVLMAIGLMVGAPKSLEPATAEAVSERQRPAPEAGVPPMEITAQDLAAAYKENTVAADQKFKGKQIQVSGTVVDINTDFLGDPYITLRGPDMFSSPHFQFEKSDLETLAKLKKGSKVTVRCTGSGDVAKTPVSRDCSIL